MGDIILLSIFGGVFGLWTYAYLRSFATKLARDIYQTYIEIFPQNPPRFLPQQAIIQPFSLPNRKIFLFSTVLLWGISGVLLPDFISALAFALFLFILIIISWLDWHYRLISPTLCQFLFALGVSCAWLKISPLSLEQSLLSAVIFFGIFYTIYYLSHFYYGREAFGRGDCWLMLAIGSVIDFVDLPLLTLLACLFGLLFVGLRRLQGRMMTSLPFAPFLSFAALLIFTINHL